MTDFLQSVKFAFPSLNGNGADVDENRIVAMVSTMGYDTPMKKCAFSEQVREAIRQSGLSQYAICKACGIDKSYMSKFMSGKVGLRMASLDQIADLIGMEVRLTPRKE